MNINLELIKVPSGTFIMGSPKNEEKHYEDEDPQHEVTVKSFFMGKYPVTQAEWKVVATLAQINRKLDPAPSYFKGDNRPVESISWYDAVEFCDRLSKETGKLYRLPSEAEWEYACRAGTTTPFSFGERITTDIVNYDDMDNCRRKTTRVDMFPSNAFGLHDMHGNVWEWCADTWHDNYDGAPNDGSAWINKEQNDNENNPQSHVVRGGSWINNPRFCRSACRNYDGPDLRSDSVGFRVVCSVH